MEEKINMNINDGDAFYAHQASINFNPTMVFLDFKNITPRVDERSMSKATIALKHNVIMLDPFHAMLFRNLLDKVIKDYEKEFGKIEKPAALKAIEKKQKKENLKNVKINTKTDIPTYFG
jgi:hypothetical protein